MDLNELNEDEMAVLDALMLMLRSAAQSSPKLYKILEPVAFQLFQLYRKSDIPPPEGNVKQVKPEDTTLHKLTGGRIH